MDPLETILGPEAIDVTNEEIDLLNLVINRIMSGQVKQDTYLDAMYVYTPTKKLLETRKKNSD